MFNKAADITAIAKMRLRHAVADYSSSSLASLNRDLSSILVNDPPEYLHQLVFAVIREVDTKSNTAT